MKRLLILAALAFAAPAAAQDVTFTPWRPPLPRWHARETKLQRAQRIASTYWPASPCAGHQQLLVTDLPDGVAGDAYPAACIAEVDRSVALSWTPSALCMVVVHEYGHLAGLGHSADPMDVMAPMAVLAPPACRVTKRDARALSGLMFVAMR